MQPTTLLEYVLSVRGNTDDMDDGDRAEYDTEFQTARSERCPDSDMSYNDYLFLKSLYDEEAYREDRLGIQSA